MHIYSLVHSIPFEGETTVGVYSSIEKARESLEEYKSIHTLSSGQDVEIVMIELDQKPAFELFGIGTRVE